MYAPASRVDRQLGIAPVIVAAAIPVASKAVSAVSKALKGIFGGTPKQRQAKREKEYRALYVLALNGDYSALDSLYGNAKSSATKESKAYAMGLFTKAVGAMTAAGLEVKTSGNHAYVRDPMAIVVDAATGATVVGSQTGSAVGPPPVVADAPVSAVSKATMPLLLGGGLVVAYLLSRRK